VSSSDLLKIVEDMEAEAKLKNSVELKRRLRRLRRDLHLPDIEKEPETTPTHLTEQNTMALESEVSRNSGSRDVLNPRYKRVGLRERNIEKQQER